MPPEQQTPPQMPPSPAPQEPSQPTPPPAQTPPPFPPQNQPLQGGPSKRPMWPLMLAGLVLVALIVYGVVYWFVLR